MRWMSVLCFVATVSVGAMDICLDSIKTDPANPGVYRDLQESINETPDRDLRSVVSIMRCICETLYSFKHSVLFPIRAIFAECGTHVTSQDWYTQNFHGKDWLSTSATSGCHYAHDPEYSAEQIIEMRSSMLSAVESILESHTSEEGEHSKIYGTIRESFDKIKAIKGKDVKSALSAISDYL